MCSYIHTAIHSIRKYTRDAMNYALHVCIEAIIKLNYFRYLFVDGFKSFKRKHVYRSSLNSVRTMPHVLLNEYKTRAFMVIYAQAFADHRAQNNKTLPNDPTLAAALNIFLHDMNGSIMSLVSFLTDLNQPSTVITFTVLWQDSKTYTFCVDTNREYDLSDEGDNDDSGEIPFGDLNMMIESRYEQMR